jgi:arylsulfatase
MFGAPAIYHDGWVAAAEPHAIPWLLLTNKPIQDIWETEKWHLYHVTPDDDWTEYSDVQNKYPDKLKELQQLFVTEGEKYNAFPLNNLPSIFNARPSLIAGRSTIAYHPGIVALNQADTPNVLNNDYSIEGDVTIPAPARNPNGVVVADGGRFGGYSLWVDHGKPVFSYNLMGTGTYRWKGANPLTSGNHKLIFNFVYDGGGFGKGGVGTLSVDGTAVDTHRVEHTAPILWPIFEGLDVGGDYSTPVDANYRCPNKFTGGISQVVFHTGPLKLAARQLEEYRNLRFAAAMSYQ